MKLIKSMVQLSLGAAFGVGMVLSCSDGSPDRVDAATCDCPASEAPLAGRLTTIDGTLATIPAGADDRVSVMCPPGTQFLSGSCTAEISTQVRNVTLQQTGFDMFDSTSPLTWYCDFRNNELAPVVVKASALCLSSAM
jgi:hypothetical protein